MNILKYLILQNFASHSKGGLEKFIEHYKKQIGLHILKMIMFENSRFYNHWSKEINAFISSFRIKLNKRDCLVPRERVIDILYDGFFKNEVKLKNEISKLELKYNIKNFKSIEKIREEAEKLYISLVNNIYQNKWSH